MKHKEKIQKIGAKIEAIREEKGLSRDALAKGVSMSRMQIYRIEVGKSNPTLDTLFEICKVLDIKIIELLSDDN